MEDLGSISVPRLMRPSTRPYTLHVFCDASEVAYRAVMYCRSDDFESRPCVTLLMVRGKAEPLRRLTIPRLELQGAVIAARMVATIVRDLQSSLDNVTFWTDSAVVLHWLKATGRRFCTFVENRISEILDITKINQWRYVPGKENLADILSRGSLLGTLKNSHWFSGLTFLWQTPESWPSSSLKTDVDVSAEELECVEAARFVSVCTSPSSEDVILQLITRTSRLNHLRGVKVKLPTVEIPKGQNPEGISTFGILTATDLRVTAWVRRAGTAFRGNSEQSPRGILTAAELSEAWETCIESVQRRCFHNRPLLRNSKLQRLNPFLDATGILRVSDRLHLSHLPFQAKHPPILPANHHFSVMLIRQIRADRAHFGVEDTLAEACWDFHQDAACMATSLHRSTTASCVCSHGIRLLWPILHFHPEFDCETMDLHVHLFSSASSTHGDLPQP
ncbi:hypothetical protein M514_20911 [Trichuris suis]|uniref:Pao retrotransposon peptidase n=1 Tax=Trichuris suis TaxID=68888 RepID=A0A085NC49_9BILA|nr:hypothetical protein M514_20911 [Trichuris suis]